jgi:hypothetical protein
MRIGVRRGVVARAGDRDSGAAAGACPCTRGGGLARARTTTTDGVRASIMRVFVKMPTGRTLTVDAGSDDTVAELMLHIYDQDADAHPALQRLAFRQAEISAENGRTLAACGVAHESELNLGLRQAAQAITLIVGGVKHVTTLETLLSNPECRLYDMFASMRDGHPPCFPTDVGGGVIGPDGIREGRALQPYLGGPLPQDCETGTYIIDRNGKCFGVILDYLRSGGEVGLPPPGQQRQQLAIEARYFGLPELAATCTVNSVDSLALACGAGITAAEIVELPSEQLEALFQEQGVGVVFASHIRAEVDAKNAQLAVEAGIAAAVDALRPELARRGAEVSAAGLRLLVDAKLSARQVCTLDQRRAQELGLSARDAQLVGALRPVAEPTLKFGFCAGDAQGRGTTTFVDTRNGTWSTAVGGEPLDLSQGSVFWKVTIVQYTDNNCMVGVIGNAKPCADSYTELTHFSWDLNGSSVWIGGGQSASQAEDGYGGIRQGDVLIFKLEAQHLSLRVARLGTKTFTIKINDTSRELRTCVCSYNESRMEFSQAEIEEEY